MVQELVSGVVVGGAVGDESVYPYARKQLPELGKRNNGGNTVVLTCFNKPQVQWQIRFDGFPKLVLWLSVLCNCNQNVKIVPVILGESFFRHSS